MFVQEFARAAQLYNDVTVLHHAGKRSDIKGMWAIKQETDRSLTKGIPTYRFWYRRSPIPDTSFLLFGFWSLLQAFRSIRGRGFIPDILHVHVYAFGALAVILGKYFGVPVAITAHSSTVAKNQLNRRQQLLARIAFNGADVVLPVSDMLRQAIRQNGCKGRLQVLPNVVDTNIFYPRHCDYSEQRLKQILFVGSLESSHKKGIPYLLEALTELKQERADWHLHIIGDGDAKAWYEMAVDDFKLCSSVTFHGFKSKLEVAKSMGRCDFFVLPSVIETFSVVLIEALASGKPVVATTSGGPDEFITQEVGILVPPKNVEALRNAINYMLDHYVDYSPTKLADYVNQRFSHKVVGSMLNEVYRQLCQSSNQAVN